MINSYFNVKNNNINNTLLVFFNDNSTPSLKDIKYDCLELYNPKPNPWFFYHIEDYLTSIQNYVDLYDNVLLFGASKGGSGAIIVSNIIKKRQIFKNILCWVFSPGLCLVHGESIKSSDSFVSKAWDRIKDNLDIKNMVDKYGKAYNYIDCTFPILYSYSFDEDWTFDKDNFNLVKEKSCVLEDYIECNQKLSNFDPNRKKSKNIHNIFGFYWKVERELFYANLQKFILENT